MCRRAWGCALAESIPAAPFHSLTHPLLADAEERPVAVLLVKRGEAPQRLHQVGGDRHLAPPLGPVALDVGPQADDRGSWLSRRSAAQRDRHSETRGPVRSMMRMAMRTGKLGAVATSAAASYGVK